MLTGQLVVNVVEENVMDVHNVLVIDVINQKIDVDANRLEGALFAKGDTVFPLTPS
jgi:hypothetical protein